MNENNKELMEFYKWNLHNLDLQKFRPNDEDVSYTLKTEIIDEYRLQILRAKSKIVNIVKSYLARQSSKLGTRYPTIRVPFLKSDAEILFNAVGISRNELYAALMEINANDIDTKNHLIQEPFNALCVIIAHVFFNEDKELVKKIKNIENVMIPDKEKYSYIEYFIILYLGIHFYSAAFIKFWKFDPTADVMDYTIENMSNKFIIKKVTSMLEFVQYHTETNIENMYDRLLRGSDVDIIYFFSNLNNRMQHAVRTIANNYYENKAEENKTGHSNASQLDESGKMFVGDIANVSSDVDASVRRVVNSFFSESIMNQKLIQASTVKTKFSNSKFIIIMKNIRENKSSEPLIREIFNATISHYLTNGGSVSSIKSNQFYLTMIKTYSLSNTRDQYILKIKDNLNKLIAANSKSILQEGNANLLDRCRAAVYAYFVLYIMYSSK